MNAHSLPHQISMEKLGGSTAKGAPDATALKGEAALLPEPAGHGGAKFSYIPSAEQWNQGVAHWGIND